MVSFSWLILIAQVGNLVRLRVGRLDESVIMNPSVLVRFTLLTIQADCFAEIVSTVTQEAIERTRGIVSVQDILTHRWLTFSGIVYMRMI